MKRRKKEKVIQTRITDNLYSKINNEANTMGMSVSNLVRNVLFNAFDLVEDIVTDGKDIAKTAQKNAYSILGLNKELQPFPDQQPSPQTSQPIILGWQEAILNLNAVCGECNDILPKGTKAAIAIMEGRGQRPIICKKCLDQLTGTYEDPAHKGKPYEQSE